MGSIPRIVTPPIPIVNEPPPMTPHSSPVAMSASQQQESPPLSDDGNHLDLGLINL